MQRDKGLARTGTDPLQAAHKALNRGIRSGVALRYELFIELRGRPPLPTRSLQILLEQVLKSKIKPVAQFMPSRRRLSLVARRLLILQVLLDPSAIVLGPMAVNGFDPR